MTLTAYLNGKRVDFIKIDCAPEDLPIHCPQDLHVGAYPNKNAWNGLVDNVRVWGKSLVWDAVRHLMNVSYVKNDSQLLAQWTCSEAAGAKVFDSSRKANHALLEGAVRSTWLPSTSCVLISQLGIANA